jgi:hypothetical protein
MKTVTFQAYNPWGSRAYCFDLWYRGYQIKRFEGHDYDELEAMAEAWAIINGFTHYTNSGRRGKL